MKKEKNNDPLIRKNYLDYIDNDPRLIYMRKISNNEDKGTEVADDSYKIINNINTGNICLSQIIALMFLMCFTCLGLYLIFYYFS